MEKAFHYWQVDAFSAQGFDGNPAGVLLLEAWPTDAEMLRIAQKLALPACAFAVKDESGAADWELSWYSAAGEITLCGHATLAAGHVLLTREGKGEVTFRTRQSGLLDVKREGDGYTIALPAIATEPKPHPQAASLLGALPTETHRSALRYNIFLFESEAEIRALAPDFVGLAKLGNDQFICTAPGNRKDIVSRVFAPGGGANEDSVTGSAHAALAPFWAAKLGRTHFSAHQASERGGDLVLRLDGSRVWLGGQCISVSEGDIVS